MRDQILTMKEVVVYLKLAEKAVHKSAVEDKVPDFKVGEGNWRFEDVNIKHWTEEKKNVK